MTNEYKHTIYIYIQDGNQTNVTQMYTNVIGNASTELYISESMQNKLNTNLATLIPYHTDCAELRSGPASATVPDLPSSKSPSRHRSHPWSLALPPCSLEEWQCSWQSHFGLSNCSTSRRPAPTAPLEGGSLNGPFYSLTRRCQNGKGDTGNCWVLNSSQRFSKWWILQLSGCLLKLAKLKSWGIGMLVFLKFLERVIESYHIYIYHLYTVYIYNLYTVYIHKYICIYQEPSQDATFMFSLVKIWRFF